MASARENDILTQVGPGTPMGELMRQYWIPAAFSAELAADGAPLRLMLLGEKLIAFRDSTGRIGVMDHRCPHRCASLFFGRNEHEGLRCVYHGWKFDVSGACVDMPNVPPEYDYKAKVRARAYRARERGGLIWVYMGERAQPPELPALEPALLPETDVSMFFCQRECNWAQALEGDIDTSHFGFLHVGGVSGDDFPPGNMSRYPAAHRQPEMMVARTELGTVYGARRLIDGKLYWRFAPFAMPFWTIAPDGDFDRHIMARAWIPMDDHHTMFLQMAWKGNAPRSRTLKSGEWMAGFTHKLDYLPNSTDWYGRWRLRHNVASDYGIDREVQRHKSFTGIDGVLLQDQAITESMGKVIDHDFEHLGYSDLMVIQTRRRLIEAAQAWQRDRTVPPGVDNPQAYLAFYAGDLLMKEERDWQEIYRDFPRVSVAPDGRVVAAPARPGWPSGAAAEAEK
jgi:phthalate 4,5-dioxygenase oxygenase subunit